MVHEPTTIVLLPGLLSDAMVWTTQKEALSRLAPTIVADFSQHDSITEMAHSVLSEGFGPLIVAGHSMGGRVALEIVRIAPSRVRGVALVDTGIDGLAPGEEVKRQALVGLAYERGMGALADAWLPPMVDPRRKTDEALLAPMKEMVMRASPDQHARQIRALIDRPDARPTLGAIACPALVMVGRQDEWSPLAQHEEIASLIGGARLVVIENSGHMSLVEQPEQTTCVLSDWVRDVLGLKRPPR